MKYHTSTTQFNCGIDLHARQMYVCVLDRDGKKLVHTNIKNNDFAYFLKLVAPYRHDLTVCAECMFGWYWLADACADAGIHFVLAHALYLKAIHGGKNKNDRLDSEKIAHLLRTNFIPPGYVYPTEKRPLRALLRQRLLYVWNRTELLARIQSHQLAHNRPTTRQTLYNREPWGKNLLASEPDPVRQLALQNDLALIGHYDAQLASPRKGTPQTHQTNRLPRFHPLANRHWHRRLPRPDHPPRDRRHRPFPPTVKDFLSYCRLVKGTVASAGKIKGLRGAKLGNPYLRWAFGEAAIIAKRDPLLGPLAQRLEARLNNKFKANTVLAIKLARAVYFMLKQKTVFDPERLVAALSKN
jgi:transposase